MADLKISELTPLADNALEAADELAIVDGSASETKRITASRLIEEGVDLISDDAIPSTKISFSAGDIATATLADSAVTTAKINADAVTAAKIADNVIVNLVGTLPASGSYTGQLALNTGDNKVYVWSGSAWLSIKAPGSVNAFTDTSAGIINIATSVSGGTATVTASIDDTTAAAQFLAGPVGSAGTVGYRAIDGGDLPTATTTAKGGVIVNGNGLVMDGSTIEIDNSVTQSSVNHLVTYDANGLITGGRVIASSDLPVATTSARGAVIASTGLAVDASGNLSIDNTVTSGTYTKVTVTAQGIVSAGDTLSADDIPDHSAAKLTSGTIGSSLIANDAVTAAKLADQSTVKFGGASGSDNVTIFPAGDFKGQMFWDETSEDLYIYSGSAFVPITVLSGNLVNAGAYDASTNTMSSVTTAGSSAGFSAGAALPAPAAGNLNHYVVVDTSGTGSGAAPAVALAPPDMLLSQGVGTEYALIDVSNAIAGQTASNISVVATGNIAATDVQAAIQEIDSEKLQKSGDTMTGALGIGTASSIVFEGSSADDYETTLTVTDPTADRTITLPNVTGTVVTTGDTGSVTSTMITDGTIVNADISSSAEIAVSKLANGTARQLLQTAANGSDVEFTSNVDIPGTLDVTGAATLDSTLTVTGLISADGKVSFPAGTAAAPSIYSGSDTDTGIYSPGSNQLAISTNGTGRLFVDSSGNVGIGTSSPSNKLDVLSTTAGTTVSARVGSTAASGANNANLIINNGGTGDATLRFDYESNTNRASIGTSASTQALIFKTAGDNERLRIDSSGNVGIGTSNPLLNLHINSATNANATIAYSENNTLKWYTRHNATTDNYEIVDIPNTSTRLAIDSSGNVGIGTSSPSSLLECNDSANDIQARFGSLTAGIDPIIRLQGKNAANTTNCFTDIKLDAENQVLLLADPGTNSSSIGTSPVAINSSGSVGIGTTNPSNLLHIAKSGGSAIFELQRTNANATGAVGALSFTANDGHSVAAVAAVGDGNDEGADLVFRTTSAASSNNYFSSTTEAMRIDSSGNVGIGVSSVIGRLHANDSSGAVLTLTRTSGATSGNLGKIRFGNTNVDSALASVIAIQDGATNNSALTFGTQSTGAAETERMRIDSLGRVGIGCTPASGFQLKRATPELSLQPTADTQTGYITFINSASSTRGAVEYNYASDYMAFKSAGSEQMRIDSSGRLLVGTSTNTDNYLFQVDSSAAQTAQFTRYGSDGATVVIGSSRGTQSTKTALNNNDYGGLVTFKGYDGSNFQTLAWVAAQCDGQAPASGDSPGRLVFSTTADGASSPTERMRITSDGYIYFNTTTSPGASGYGSGFLQIGASGSRRTALYQRAESTSASSIQAFYNPNGTVGSITTSGSATSYNTSSDHRLKENVVDITDGITRVKQLQPKRFNFIADADITVDGFFAHEAQAVVPEAVTGTHNEVDDDGNPVMQGIDQSKLVPLLTAALQEAIAKIETLEAKVAALEAS